MKHCEYGNCESIAKFGMFRLNSDGSKTWVNLCNLHDRLTDYNNRMQRERHPNKTFKEVKSENHNNLQVVE
jgi:hypothetical protein